MESLRTGLRRDEFTGDRRCWPCTVVNLAILGVLSALVALRSVPGAVLVALAGCLGVWLRGYLVPYTPRFAPRLANALPWDPFHADGESDPPRADGGSDSLATPEGTDGEAVMQALGDAGVIRVTDDVLELDDSFETAWEGEMERLASLADERLAAETLDASHGMADADVHQQGDRTYVVLTDGTGSPAGEAWLRRPVAVVETAAAETLRDWSVDPSVRPAAAHAMGLFLTTCPECGGEVTERPASGCCGPPETGPNGEVLQARVCERCEVRYHVFE